MRFYDEDCIMVETENIMIPIGVTAGSKDGMELMLKASSSKAITVRLIFQHLRAQHFISPFPSLSRTDFTSGEKVKAEAHQFYRHRVRKRQSLRLYGIKRRL